MSASDDAHDTQLISALKDMVRERFLCSDLDDFAKYRVIHVRTINFLYNKRDGKFFTPLKIFRLHFASDVSRSRVSRFPGLNLTFLNFF